MSRPPHANALRDQLRTLEPPELSPRFYDQLRQQIASAPARRQRFRRVLFLKRGALAATAAVLVVALVPALTNERGSRLDVTDQAYAALAPSDRILHYVVRYPNSLTGRPYYEEHWVDTSNPTHRRVVQSDNGEVIGQLTYAGNDDGQAPAPQAGGEPSRAGLDPLSAYREMLRLGDVRSQREVTLAGKPAYEIVVQHAVRGVPLTTTYVVDRASFYPLALTNEGPDGTVSRAEYVSYEVLDRTPQTERLLDEDTSPTAFTE